MTVQDMAKKLDALWQMEPHVKVLDSPEEAPDHWMRMRLSQVPGTLDLSDYICCMQGMELDAAGTWVAAVTDELLARANVLAAVRCLRAGIEYVMEHFDVSWEENEFWQDMAGWMSEMEQGIVFNFQGDLLASCAAYVDPVEGIGAYSYMDLR